MTQTPQSKSINKSAPAKGRLFRRLSLVTLFAVYLLIAVGGIVRSTGAGMGCPDWPKCFGSWVPPTEVSQLPPDYKAVYASQRAAKNERFVKYLNALGFTKQAQAILNDPSILVEADFNAAKTWIEYVNRLIGAVIGLLILGTFVVSITYWKRDKVITALSFLALVAVAFQGWIGSIVVSTNLLSWMISVHMLIALFIVALLIYVVFRSRKRHNTLQNLPIWQGGNATAWIVLLAMAALLVQIVLGTEVRAGIDHVAASLPRSQWIANLGTAFLVHRSYSWVIVVLQLFISYKLWQKGKQVRLYKQLSVAMLAVVLSEVLLGIIMAYGAVPAFAQPLHLVLACGIFGLMYYVFLVLRYKAAPGTVNA